MVHQMSKNSAGHQSREGHDQPQTVEIFRKMEEEGLCDGFLWPYEGGRLNELKWANGEKAIAYETSRGTLWMRTGMHKHYGFSEDYQFAKAAKAGRLLVNKSRGIITVGAARIRRAGGKFVYLITPDCPVKFQFVVNSPEEEAVVTDALSRNFKECRIFSSAGFLGGIYYPTHDFWTTYKAAMYGPYRRDLLFLMFLGLVTLCFTVTGIFVNKGLLGSSLAGFLFVLMTLRFFNRVSESEDLEGRRAVGAP